MTLTPGYNPVGLSPRLVIYDENNLAGIEILENADFRGCDSIITIDLFFEIEGVLGVAEAGKDTSLCVFDFTLDANLPPNTQGIWSTNLGAFIIDDTNPSTMVNDMPVGENIFTWTLSSENCPEYSSDNVSIFIESTPVAINDVYMIDLTRESSIFFNPVTADDGSGLDSLNGIVDWSFSINSPPINGVAVPDNSGNVTYTPNAGFSGRDSLSYSICSDACSELCDNATIVILVDDELFIPSGFTPNGDGLNDAFVIPTLNNIVSNNSELIVVNRWNDVVFEANPYVNDWKGTRNGKPLPAGTYFYTFQLSKDDEVLSGKVTIVR